MEGPDIVVILLLLVRVNSVRVHPEASQGQEGGWIASLDGAADRTVTSMGCPDGDCRVQAAGRMRCRESFQAGR